MPASFMTSQTPIAGRNMAALFVAFSRLSHVDVSQTGPGVEYKLLCVSFFSSLSIAPLMVLRLEAPSE